MFRGFATTLGLVSAITLGAWAFADQTRTAKAVAVAEMTPATASTTTNSNLAAKGDRLAVGVRLSGAASVDRDGSIERITAAHAMATEAAHRYMTVALPTGEAETTLKRVSLGN
jgi:hypothetical protein